MENKLNQLKIFIEKKWKMVEPTLAGEALDHSRKLMKMVRDKSYRLDPDLGARLARALDFDASERTQLARLAGIRQPVDNREIVALIRRKMATLSMNASQLAREVGDSHSLLPRLESGARRMTLLLATKIAAALHFDQADTDELFRLTWATIIEPLALAGESEGSPTARNVSLVQRRLEREFGGLLIRLLNFDHFSIPYTSIESIQISPREDGTVIRVIYAGGKTENYVITKQ